MTSYVLSIIGTDRTGLVEALADVVTEHGGNWQRSHVTELAGTFAGVVLVAVPDHRGEGFREALVPLQERGLLDVTVHGGERADDEEDEEDEGVLTIELVGNDRPGIVRDVSRLLATLEVNIVDLRTWTVSAAMAGGTLFHAEAEVRLPADLTAEALADHLEELTNELMVDVSPPR